MLKLVDISYYADNKLNSISEIYPEVTGYALELKDKYKCFIIRHLNKEEEKNLKGVVFKSFISKNNFFYIPFKTHKYLKNLKPDVVIIQGFSFPLQTIFLRKALGNKAIILLQHRQGGVFRFPKKTIQQLADKSVNGYLFTAKQIAECWFSEKIISDRGKCFELLGASTNFTRQNKENSRKLVGMEGGPNFLYVGRLNENKDPVCILTAFGKYLTQNTEAKLYIIYQENKLHKEIKELFENNTTLKNAVKMIGPVNHADLVHWYSAADFYLSGSHNESTGFSLLESLACACIPIVTHIPTYQKMLAGSKLGYFFAPGNSDDLLNILLNLNTDNSEQQSSEIEKHFKANLSFKAIANNLEGIINSLLE